MAHAHVNLTHGNNGKTDRAPVGFSWTVLFFGFLPPLFRGDMAWAGGLFVAALILSFVFAPLLLVMWPIVGSIYNKKYLEGKLEQGYKIKSVERAGGTATS